MNRFQFDFLRTAAVAVFMVGFGAGSVTAFAAGPVSQDAAADVDDGPRGDITLETALAYARSRNPALKAAGLAVRGREARASQEGLPPNPELEIEIENFGGNGGLSGFDSAEYTVGLAREIQLGGKRKKRVKLATVETGLAEWDRRAALADLEAGVKKAFFELLVAQDRVALMEESARTAAELAVTASARVEAGKVPQIEEMRAQVSAATATLDQNRARRRLDTARRNLAEMWGATTPRFDRAVGNAETVLPLVPFEVLEALLPRNPDVARWADERTANALRLELEKAGGIPDPEIVFGVRNVRETDEYAFVAGVSIPLPLFDRNQGAISEARYALDRVEQERESAYVGVKTSLSRAYNDLRDAYSRVLTLRESVLPAAETAFARARDGYRYGKYDYLVMLDAQQTVFASKADYLDAIEAYHNAVIQVERLTGTPYIATAPPKNDTEEGDSQ